MNGVVASLMLRALRNETGVSLAAAASACVSVAVGRFACVVMCNVYLNSDGTLKGIFRLASYAAR